VDLPRQAAADSGLRRKRPLGEIAKEMGDFVEGCNSIMDNMRVFVVFIVLHSAE